MEKEVQTLYEILSKKFRGLKPKEGLFGIEIETEVPKETDYPKGFLVRKEDPNSPVGFYWIVPSLEEYWKGVYDGSLRNFGVEYVLKEPLSYHQTIKALDDFSAKTEKVPFLEDQPGTSVHVHVNFLNEKPVVLANFIVISTLFENILAEFSGRRSNLFAWPHRVAEGSMKHILKLFSCIDSGTHNGLQFHEQHAKYCLLNICPITKYGSVELRSFRGTTDTEAIKDWINIIHKIMEYSRTPGLTPRTFYSTYRDRQFEMITDVFGEYSERLKADGWQDMIQRNEFYFAKYATSVKDWDSFGSKYPMPRTSKKSQTDEFIEITQATLAAGNFSPFHIQPMQVLNVDAGSSITGVESTTVVLDDYPDDLPDFEDDDDL